MAARINFSHKSFRSAGQSQGLLIGTAGGGKIIGRGIARQINISVGVQRDGEDLNAVRRVKKVE